MLEKNNIDIFLMESFSSRLKTCVDCTLGQTMATLRSHLHDHGFRAKIFDYVRIFHAEEGIPKWYGSFVRNIVSLQNIFLMGKLKFIGVIILLISFPFQQLSLFLKRKEIERKFKENAEYIRQHQIPFVGIKFWTGEAFQKAIDFAGKVKKDSPQTVVIAGGPLVTLYPEGFVNRDEIDILVKGPGEIVLTELLSLRREHNSKEEFLRAVKKKFGTFEINTDHSYWLQSNELTDLTIPRYEDEDKIGKLHIHFIVDSVGCSWGKCSFCQYHRLHPKYHRRKIDDIIKEIKEMINNGIGLYRFVGSDVPLSFGKKIADAILTNELKINYCIFSRAGKVTEERYSAYKTMIKSGLRYIFIGGESGHEEINLKIIKKGVKKQELIDTIRAINKAALEVGEKCYCVLALIYPTPTLDGIKWRDIYEENLSLIDQANPDAVCVYPPVVFPQTDWAENPSKYFFKLTENYFENILNVEFGLHTPQGFFLKNPGITLNGISPRSVFFETLKLAKEIRKRRDFVLFSELIYSPHEIEEIHKQINTDLMSGSVKYISQLVDRINKYSKKIADLNKNME